MYDIRMRTDVHTKSFLVDVLMSFYMKVESDKWNTTMEDSSVSVIDDSIQVCPLFGTVITLTNRLQHCQFFVGPKVTSISPSPVKTISEYIAKRTDSEEFVTLKMLSLSPEGSSTEDIQGKLLLHNEHSILSLLQDQVGVIQQQGLFRERGKIVLVLDCYYQHKYSNNNQHKDYINLQQYVIKEKRLPELKALQLFYQLVSIVKEIHKKKIVHRDLKLANVILNQRTNQLILTSFSLGKHLVQDDELLSDQRGSLAYVSPDVISGEPYYGKPSDMWSLGVLLYTMVSGQFPYYDSVPQELFRKIKSGKFALPRDVVVSMETVSLMRELMDLDQRKRLTADAAVDTVRSILSRLSFTLAQEPVQIVPEMTFSPSSECLVPEQSDYTPQVNAAELTAPRLHFTMDSGDSSLWQSSHSPISVSPMSPNPPSLFVYPEAITHINNPFLQQHSHSILSSSTQSLPPNFLSHFERALPGHPTTDSLSSSYRRHLHPHSAANHRHSFSEGDPASNLWLRRLLTTGPMPMPSHGRRSLGSMTAGPGQEYVLRTRRNSLHSHSLNVVGSDVPRRRRSHEPQGVEQDLLQNMAIRHQHGLSPSGRSHSAGSTH